MNGRLRFVQGGFTLLEVLVAVVVFSIGLLGIAGLQVAGMRYTHGSQLRAVATMQAENMADSMRANSLGVTDGLYNVLEDMPTSYTTDCTVDPCGPEELARFDLVTWNAAAATGKPHESNADILPGGAGVVCVDSTPNDGSPDDWACDNEGAVYAIKLAWTERTAGADDLVENAEGEEEAADIRQEFMFVRFVP